jgi:hypothetical protein
VTGNFFALTIAFGIAMAFRAIYTWNVLELVVSMGVMMLGTICLDISEGRDDR